MTKTVYAPNPAPRQGAPQLRDLTKYMCRNGNVYWRLNADDARLELTTKELQDPRLFNDALARAGLEQCSTILSFPPMPQSEWHATLGSLVSEMRTVNQ